MKEQKRFIEQLITQLKEQGVFDAIGDGVSIQDTEFKVLYQNQVHKNFVGSHVGEYCYEAYEKRERTCDGCPVAMAFKDGKPHTTERSAPTERGISYFEITASPIRDSSGKIIAGIEIARDITEHKRKDELLRKAGEEWKHTFDSISDFVSVHDKDFRCIKVNKALADFKGVKPEELIREHCYKVFHGSTNPWHDCPHVKMLEVKKTVTVEIDDPHIGRPLLVTVSPIFDEKGELTGGVHIARDITELKKSEEKLKVMDWAIRSSMHAIVLADLEGNLTFVNPVFLKLWGYDSDEGLLGSPCTRFWQEKEKSKEIIEALRDKGAWAGERVAVRKDGAVFMVELAASMVRDEAGKPICIMASLVDITERKRMEGEIKERVDELEKFYQIAVDREVKMKELKKEIEKLKSRPPGH